MSRTHSSINYPTPQKIQSHAKRRCSSLSTSVILSITITSVQVPGLQVIHVLPLRTGRDIKYAQQCKLPNTSKVTQSHTKRRCSSVSTSVMLSETITSAQVPELQVIHVLPLRTGRDITHIQLCKLPNTSKDTVTHKTSLFLSIHLSYPKRNNNICSGARAASYPYYT
ncbi:hypothetical protein BaRGS_00006570 [Batillaria attramentaria]|uniref:Uncharacterized protein n=1 Tax=Batillaria attramentaria TaxID=370345 RepID=A0ABD0LSR1_9CAEN